MFIDKVHFKYQIDFNNLTIVYGVIFLSFSAKQLQSILALYLLLQFTLV